jgi:hypothetical protein
VNHSHKEHLMPSLLLRCPLATALIVLFLAFPFPAAAQPPGVISTESKTFTLSVDTEVARKLVKVEELIKAEALGSAFTLLRQVLDLREDVLIQVKRKGQLGVEYTVICRASVQAA